MSVTIECTEPFASGHGGSVRKIVLREPKAKDLFELGEPVAYARHKDGAMFSVENAEIIQQYIERLVIEPDPLLLGNINFRDGYAVKDAVLGFFTNARLGLSETGPGSSSSISKSSPQPSAQK